MIGFARAFDRDRDLESAPGLMLNTPDGPRFTGHAPTRGQLDDLPMPARHLISEYVNDYYINFRKPLALLETARGCPYRCNFCSVWKFHEKTFREKSPERVVRELSDIEAYSVFITDDIFWMNVERGKEMARQIQASGIHKHFSVQTRTDIIVRFPEVIEMWKECGELQIFLGLEKIDDEGLAAVNKNNTAANNEEAVKILKELGVGITPNFIVDPTWGREDFAKLREWIERNGMYNSGFSVLTPLPGTDLWDEVKDSITTHDWELYDIVHAVTPTKLPLRDFYEEYANLWRFILDLRYRTHGRFQSYAKLAAALALGRVSFGAIRKGMNLAKVFSKAETFLAGHRRSEVAASDRKRATAAATP